MERYHCIYVYKMLNGLVPDLGLNIYSGPDTRSDQTLHSRAIHASNSSVRTKLCDSILVNGVKLFNTLPKWIRDIKCDLSLFKKELDRFLRQVPDQPELPGYIPEPRDIYGKPSNSLIDWVRLLVSEGRLEVPPDPGDGDIPSNDCIFDEREAMPT